MMAILEFEDEVEPAKEIQKQKLIDALNKLGIKYDVIEDQVRIPGSVIWTYDGTITVEQPPDRLREDGGNKSEALESLDIESYSLNKRRHGIWRAFPRKSRSFYP